MAVKLFNVSGFMITYKVMCSIVSAKHLLCDTCDFLEGGALYSYCCLPSLGQTINLDCIIMFCVFPSSEEEIFFLRYFHNVILQICVNEKWLQFWNAGWILVCTEFDLPF